MKQHLDALRNILDHGEDRPTRQGGRVRSLFGMQMRYRMADGFPAVTTKKLAFQMVVDELLWFLSGSQDVNDLRRHGTNIWDGDAEKPAWKAKAAFDGDAGRIYGVQWRRWRTPDGREIDQLAELLRGLREDPHGRRHIVTAWNPGEMDQMCLPPCHALFQIFVSRSRLSLQMYQRSCDMFLGVPFNIASYSLLLHMLARAAGLELGDFVHTLGDAHIYHEHFDAVRQQLSREPLPLPDLWLDPEIRHIDDFRREHVRLVDYRHQGRISAPLLV